MRLRDIILNFSKNANFRLFDMLSVWAEILTTGEIISNRENTKCCSSGLRQRFAFYLILKEGFMNKKILAISVLMLIVCTMASFAQNRDADQLARDARTALSTASTERSRALQSRDSTFVLQQANRILAEYERISTRLNNLTNRGVEINDSNLREIGRCADSIQEFFNEVKRHHERLLMR
jgi:hypothetical protein